MLTGDFRRGIIGHERDPHDPAQTVTIARVGNFLHLECGHRVLHFDPAEQVTGEVECPECRDKVSGKGT